MANATSTMSRLTHKVISIAEATSMGFEAVRQDYDVGSIGCTPCAIYGFYKDAAEADGTSVYWKCPVSCLSKMTLRNNKGLNINDTIEVRANIIKAHG